MDRTSRHSLIASNLSHAGLGNRMRFTLSAQSLAEAEEREFSYVWPRSELFRPALTDLWEFEHAEMQWAESVKLAEKIPFESRAEDLDPASNVWHVRGGNALTLPSGAPSWAELFRRLVPTALVKSRVNALHAKHFNGDPYVGVMVRAHEKSHSKTREASPVEWYLKRMTEICATQKNIKFFVSCDVPAVQDQILSAFPNSVGQDDKGEYNSAQGVVSSVVDLYLLASSNYMLVPYWSSFPALAWELADRKVTMEDSQKLPLEANITNASVARDPLRPADR